MRPSTPKCPSVRCQGARRDSGGRWRRRCGLRVVWLEDRVLLSSPGDGYGQDLAHATPIALTADGAAQLTGTIETGADTDTFTLVARKSGALWISLDSNFNSDTGAPLPSGYLSYLHLEAFDAKHHPISIAHGDPQAFFSISFNRNQSFIHVTAGQAYYLQLSSADLALGNYVLTMTTAQPITLAADGSGTVSGMIVGPADWPVVEFVAPVTGQTNITLDTSQFRYPIVFDSQGHAIGSTPTFRDQTIGTRLVAGQIYYLSIGPITSPSPTGSFPIAFSPTIPDDFGNNFATAYPLTPDALQAGQTGRIDYPGDVDMFQFVAPWSGRMEAELDAAPGSGLDTLISAFDFTGISIVSGGAEGPGNLVSRLVFDVAAGQTYYVQAAAAPNAPSGQDTGAFSLHLSRSSVQFGQEVEPNDTLSTANPIASDSQTTGAIAPLDVEVFRITLLTTSRLTAMVHAQGFYTRLTLLDAQGNVMIQSDGQSLRDRDDQIVQSLPSGDYYLRVEGLDGGTGSYTLTTRTQLANLPDQRPPLGVFSTYMVAGDFNGDGNLDLAVCDQGDVSVLLGLGDGTFAPAVRYMVPFVPAYPLDDIRSIVTGDFNGDGKLDLAVTDPAGVSVLLGNGDGTFAPAVTY